MRENRLIKNLPQSIQLKESGNHDTNKIILNNQIHILRLPVILTMRITLQRFESVHAYTIERSSVHQNSCH